VEGMRWTVLLEKANLRKEPEKCLLPLRLKGGREGSCLFGRKGGGCVQTVLETSFGS